MKKELIIETVSYLLILLFLYTGISKFIDFDRTVFNLEQAPIVHYLPRFWGIVIPTSETIVAFLLFFPKTRHIGLLCSFMMMLTFTLYVAYMLTFLTGLERPCSCGGIFQKMSWRMHLLVNSIFTVMSLIALFLQTKLNGNNFIKMESAGA